MGFAVRFFLLIVSLCGMARVARARNSRPVIGILTQPSSDRDAAQFGASYVVASYVKYVEASGARAVPVMWDSPPSELRTLLTTQLNGLLLPGGGANITASPYKEAWEFVLGLAWELNLAGTTFPIWGTCMGFEQLMVFVANDTKVLSGLNAAENVLLPLSFQAKASPDADLMSEMPEAVRQTLTSRNATVHMHNQGVLPQTFADYPSLDRSLRLVATAVDSSGEEFVALVEGRTIPVYGSQFHPEKNGFEWSQLWESPEAHSREALAASSFFSEFFVDRCRDSENHFDKTELLFAAYNPVYTSQMFPDEHRDDQNYYFNSVR